MISVPVNKVLPDIYKLRKKLYIGTNKQEQLLQLVIDEVKLLVDPRYAFKQIKFDHQIMEELINASKDLKMCLNGAKEGFVVVATLYGAVIPEDPVIVMYTDRLLSDMVENLAEIASKELLSRFYPKENSLTKRYSPGYGDMHLSTQKKIFSLFADAKIDVTLNEYFYMRPEKSISYIVGVK